MADLPTVAITGATGFIGGKLVRHYKARGFRVVALSRRPPLGLPDIEHRVHDLGRPPSPNLLSEVDYLVHAAFVAGDRRVNVAGAAGLLEASVRHGISQRVFLSSLSARSDARSKYGQQKYEIEKLFAQASGCNLRLGLVLGNGGLFQKLATHVRRGGVIPLVDGGRQPLQVVHVDEVIRAVDNVLSRNLSGSFAVAHPTPIMYRDFYETLCAIVGTRPRFVPVPSALLLVALGACEWLGVRLPITTENVWGLKQGRPTDTSRDLVTLGIAIPSARERLERMRGMI